MTVPWNLYVSFSSSLCLLLTPLVVRGCRTPLAQLRPALPSLPEKLPRTEVRRRISLPKKLDRAVLPPSIVPISRSPAPTLSCRSPVGLSRRGRRPTSARAQVTTCSDSVSLHALVGHPPRFGGPARLPRAVRVEKGPRELGRLRLAAARAALTAPTAGPLTWVWRGVDPGRFRPMCATHDLFFKVGCPMSRLTPPRSHAVSGTPGFTPERRFGELALHVRAFLPGASCAAYL